MKKILICFLVLVSLSSLPSCSFVNSENSARVEPKRSVPESAASETKSESDKISPKIISDTMYIINLLEKQDYNTFDKNFPEYYEKLIDQSGYEESFDAGLKMSKKIKTEGFARIINKFEELCIDIPELESENMTDYLEYLSNYRLRYIVYLHSENEEKAKEVDNYMETVNNHFIENIKHEASNQHNTQAVTS